MKFYADEHDLGDVLSEPFQIRFAPLRRRRSPDIIFVSAAREKLFAKAHFEGGPDLIVEVVSRESQSRDRRDKYMEYQLAGVREYWVIDPLLKQIEIHALGRNKRYSPLIEKDGIIRSTVLTGFFIRPEWLWQLKAPKISAVLGEIAAGG
jgi:Uma2 family endonuclease